MLEDLFEFLHNSKYPAKSWQDPASIEGEEHNKKNSLPGIEPTTSRSSVPHSANCASKESVGKEISEVSFVSYTASHVGLCSFLESIEYDFMKALMIDTDNKIVT